jgi:hypothetical protein
MLAYGYEWSSGEERPQILREASLVCTQEELDDLITMLQEFRDGQPLEQEGDHKHFRDWNEGWSKQSSDFIIFIADQPWTKENQE